MTTTKKIEEEIFINPRMKDFCSFERQNNPQKCGECEGVDPLDGIFCMNNRMAWRMSNIEKLLQAILTELQKRT